MRILNSVAFKMIGLFLVFIGFGGIVSGDYIPAMIVILIGIYFLFKKKKLKDEHTSNEIVNTAKTANKMIDDNKDTIGKDKDESKFDFINKIENYTPNGTEFISLDVETTGLSTEYDRIIEIAAIKFSDCRDVETFNTLINPKRKIPDKATAINGISNDMVKNKPTIYQILPELLQFIGDCPIIAHNVMFDIGFIKNTCKRRFKDDNYWIENQLIDTVKLSREMFPELSNHKLDSVIKHLNLDIKNRHRALDDAYASAQIYLEYLQYNKIKKDKKLQALTTEEIETFEIIKNILIKNNRPIELLDIYKTKTYFDLTYNYPFLRFKLNGNKKYLLYDKPVNEIDLKYKDTFKIEKPSKAEENRTRIMIDTIEDIGLMKDIILNSYDETIAEYEKIQKYLKNRKTGPLEIKIKL